MRQFVLAALATVMIAGSASAALPVGSKAPDFATKASLAGKPFDFRLSEALKRGPVVLYFYPAAFTAGCTIEAHEFAEATDDFKALGATVIGMSADDIATLNRFSREACRDKFAVASASPGVIARYDVALKQKAGLSDRTSYVIAPDGRILYTLSQMNPRGHVSGTMAAVKAWAAAQKR
jgi:peroxiredoxin Q/BCP